MNCVRVCVCIRYASVTALNVGYVYMNVFGLLSAKTIIFGCDKSAYDSQIYLYYFSVIILGNIYINTRIPVFKSREKRIQHSRTHTGNRNRNRTELSGTDNIVILTS